ncbi:MAG: cyclic nucleotide-binding domain-containing protein [Fibrobacterota bacterium]
MYNKAVGRHSFWNISGKPSVRTPIKPTKKGTHLFHDNDFSRELYTIQSGAISVYRAISNRGIQLAVLKKGSVLEEITLIYSKPRSASARGYTATVS